MVRAVQVNATLAATLAAVRAAGLDGVGWDLKAITLLIQPTIALFIADFRAAWPVGFQAFYIGNLLHRNKWEAPAACA